LLAANAPDESPCLRPRIASRLSFFSRLCVKYSYQPGFDRLSLSGGVQVLGLFSKAKARPDRSGRAFDFSLSAEGD
jgi:hypothetical protein